MSQVAGIYDRVLTLNQYSESVDSYGTRSLSWTTVAANIPCRVEPSGGNEVFNEEQRVALGNITFGIRYTYSFTPKEAMQIVYNGATYNIQNVIENTKVGRRVEYLITAISKDNS